MAQEDDGSSWWGSWTSGILDNVREKTSSALDFVQNDLSEFVSTIQHDTSIVIADSATAVNNSITIEKSEKYGTTGKLKQGFSNLLQNISTSLHHAAESGTEEVSSQHDDRTDEQRLSTAMLYDRTQVRLHEVQTDPETYRKDPDGDNFRTWCETFNLDNRKGEISELLVNNPEVRRLYTKFVPIIQSHSTFWHRYFYKVHEIESEKKRLADIVARANQSDDEQVLGWDDDDDDLNVTAKDAGLNPTRETKAAPAPDNIPKLEEDKNCLNLKELNIGKIDERNEAVSSKTTVSEDVSEITTANSSLRENESDKETVNEYVPDHNETNETNERNEAQNNLVQSEQKSEEYKSDSSDSNSWIRVSDKEGSSTNSSESVVVVNEKEKEHELTWDDDVNDNDDDDDIGDDDNDDDLDLNEDISKEDVDKLVQTITAHDLDSDEDDWESWE